MFVSGGSQVIYTRRKINPQILACFCHPSENGFYTHRRNTTTKAITMASQNNGNRFHEFSLLISFPDKMDEYGITSFGVSVTTLEEVFMKVGEGAEKTVDNLYVKPTRCFYNKV